MISKFTFHKFDQVKSTQTIAKDLIIQSKLSHGDVVIASSQTHGRGRYDRTWISPEGGVYLTARFKPERDIADWSQVSYVVGVSLCEAIKKIDSKCLPALKWVNDILINDQKVAGILLEIAQGSLLVGVGVNIGDSGDAGVLGTSLLSHSKAFTKAKVIEIFFERLKYNYNLWCEKGFEPIRALWVRSAIGIGTEIEVRFKERSQKGIFIGINEIGQLQLLEGGAIKLISAGDVYFC